MLDKNKGISGPKDKRYFDCWAFTYTHFDMYILHVKSYEPICLVHLSTKCSNVTFMIDLRPVSVLEGGNYIYMT